MNHQYENGIKFAPVLLLIVSTCIVVYVGNNVDNTSMISLSSSSKAKACGLWHPVVDTGKSKSKIWYVHSVVSLSIRCVSDRNSNCLSIGTLVSFAARTMQYIHHLGINSRVLIRRTFCTNLHLIAVWTTLMRRPTAGYWITVMTKKTILYPRRMQLHWMSKVISQPLPSQRYQLQLHSRNVISGSHPKKNLDHVQTNKCLVLGHCPWSEQRIQNVVGISLGLKNAALLMYAVHRLHCDSHERKLGCIIWG